VCPALLEYVANELAIASDVQKQTRKAEKERLLAQKSKKGPKKKDEE